MTFWWRFLVGWWTCWLVQLCAFWTLVVLPRRRHRHRHRDKLYPDAQLLHSFEAESKKLMVDTFATALPYFDAYAEGETCLWLNSILSRLFCQVTDGNFLNNALAKKLSIELQETCMSWIGCALLVELQLENFQLPDGPPTLKNTKVFRRKEDLSSFFAITEWAYNPGITVELRGQWNFGIPFRIKADVSNCKAKVYLRMSRSESIVSWSLLEMPTFDLALEFCIAEERPCPEWLKTILLESVLPWKLQRTFVAPHCVTFRTSNSSSKNHSKETKDPQVSALEAGVQPQSTTLTPAASTLLSVPPASTSGADPDTQREPFPSSTSVSAPSPSLPSPTTILSIPFAPSPTAAETRTTDVPRPTEVLSRSESIASTATVASSVATPSAPPSSSSTGASSKYYGMANRLMKNVSTYREQLKEQMPAIREKVSTSAGGLLTKLQEKRGSRKGGGLDAVSSSTEATLKQDSSTDATLKQDPFPSPAAPAAVPTGDLLGFHADPPVLPPTISDDSTAAATATMTVGTSEVRPQTTTTTDITTTAAQHVSAELLHEAMDEAVHALETEESPTVAVVAAQPPPLPDRSNVVPSAQAETPL